MADFLVLKPEGLRAAEKNYSCRHSPAGVKMIDFAINDESEKICRATLNPSKKVYPAYSIMFSKLYRFVLFVLTIQDVTNQIRWTLGVISDFTLKTIEIVRKFWQTMSYDS